MRSKTIMGLAFIGVCAAATFGRVYVPTVQENFPVTKKKSSDNKGWPSPETKAKMKAVRAAQLNAYFGTEAFPASNVSASELDLQKEIAAAFSQKDPKVADRSKTFSWCFSDPNLRVTGWWCIIQRVSKATNGYDVQVKTRPRIAGTYGTSLYSGDYCLETWSYSDGKLTYVKSERPAGLRPPEEGAGRAALMGD